MKWPKNPEVSIRREPNGSYIAVLEKNICDNGGVEIIGNALFGSEPSLASTSASRAWIGSTERVAYSELPNEWKSAFLCFGIDGTEVGCERVKP